VTNTIMIRLCCALLLGSAIAAPAQLSKGHLILIKRGLQVQGMVTRDDVFHLNTYSNANYTSIHWLWTSSMSAAFPWSRWVSNESNMPPVSGEAPYLGQLVTLQLGDEWNLNDAALRTRAVNWFAAVRSNFPNTILYMNNFGGQVGDSQLADFTARARPDMLCFDTYPWKSDYTTRAPISGPPNNWYGDLRRYREHARDARVPLGAYVQTFHAVQDYDRTVYRDPSPSELRLNHFAALAFNAKVLIDFTYNTGASSLFVTPGGDSNPTALFAEKTDCNLRARNFGKALVRLGPVADATRQYTTSMMLLRGRRSDGTPTPVPIGFIPDPSAPNDYTDWVSDRNDPYLRGWSVTNKPAIKNAGQRGDVIISWFKPLDESFDGPNHSNQVYFMVVNGLTDPTGSAADCMQEIRLNFAFPAAITSVDILNPTNGQVQNQTLPIVSTRRQLVLNLNGGDAALFKPSTGAPFAGFLPPAGARLDLRVQTNAAAIRIQGTVASSYQVQKAQSLPPQTWAVVTNVQLPSTPHVIYDVASSNTVKRFYRALTLP
jgi:hypothetical protein